MRTSMLVGIRRDNGKSEVLATPNIPTETQRADFKAAKAVATHPVYREVQLWESGSGITARAKLDAPSNEPIEAVQSKPRKSRE